MNQLQGFRCMVDLPMEARQRWQAVEAEALESFRRSGFGKYGFGYWPRAISSDVASARALIPMTGQA